MKKSCRNQNWWQPKGNESTQNDVPHLVTACCSGAAANLGSMCRMIRKREWSASEPERRQSRQEPFLAIKAWKQSSLHHRSWRLRADTGSGRPWGNKRSTLTEDLGEGLEKSPTQGPSWRVGRVTYDGGHHRTVPSDQTWFSRSENHRPITHTRQGLAGLNSTAGEANRRCMSRTCGRMQGADSTVEQQSSNWNHGAP